jgi:hypothetical protein
MTSKYLIRSVGVLTCMAVVATGWDAEAGWRRHHHRRAACCEPVCCEPVYEPVCCEPVRETACCEPVRETVCCETVIVVPATTCCTNSIVVTEKAATNVQASVMKTESSQQATAARGTTAKAASLTR